MLGSEKDFFEHFGRLGLELGVFFAAVSEGGTGELIQDVRVDLYGTRDKQSWRVFPVWHITSSKKSYSLLIVKPEYNFG